jgi:hypothetical protein
VALVSDRRCLWCETPLEPTPGRRAERLFCSDAHRARYKRTQRAVVIADVVERLGPHIADSGIDIYKELVDHLAGRVNEEV